MKICTRCKKSKSLEDFRKYSRSKDGLQSSCRECISNWEKQAQKIKTREQRDIKNNHAYERTKRNRQFIFDYLRSHPCKDCGNNDPIVLEFDHIDPNTKKNTVSDLASYSSLEVVKKEIDKCEVRCANCHRRKTALQLGWYKEVV